MASVAKRTSEPGDLRKALRRAVRRADRDLLGPRVVLACKAARGLDAACAEEFAIPSLLLMERASLGIAAVVMRACARRGAAVLVLAGSGNNGGDGLAVARHLVVDGQTRLAVALIADPERLVGDAAANRVMAEQVGVRIVPAADRTAVRVRQLGARLGRPLLIVDALLGTGLARPASGAVLEAIRACNALRAADTGVAVLSVDVPSGMDADTGLPPQGGECIQADAVLTMAGYKPGLLSRTGRQRMVPVGVLAIGAPARLLRRFGRPWNPASIRRGGRPLPRDAGG